MPLPPWMRPALVVLGGLFLLAGVAGIGAGTLAAARLRELLHTVQADAPVVGGAAVAFGTGLGLLGAAHLAVALRLDRPSRALRAGAVVGALTLAMVALVGLATVGVSLAREASAAPLWATVPWLIAGAIVYGWLAVGMLRAQRR